VYGLVGKKWSKLPFQLYADEQRIETYLTATIPNSVVAAQTQAQTPVISADLSVRNPLPAPVSAVLAEVNPTGLTIADGGGVAGSVPTIPEASAASPYQVLPTVSNRVGDQLRSDLVDDMLTNEKVRKQHVQALVDLAVEKLYPGLNIDYQDITGNNKNEFNSFIRELAQALHAREKILSVTLAMPTQKSADVWDTGAFDWDTIGREADIVKIPLPSNREAYAGSSPAVQTYLRWAVGRVDRYKLELTFSAMGRDEFGPSFTPIGFANALKLMGPLTVSDKIAPGAQATFDLSKIRDGGGIKYDAVTGLYSFTYKDDKAQAHTIWLENADSLAKKMALTLQFNLRGVALRDLGADGVDARVWEALKQYSQSQIAVFKNTLTIVWRVNGQLVGKSPASDPKFIWTAPTQTGDAKIEALFSFDDGQSAAGATGSVTVQITKAQATKPTPAPADTTAAPKPTPVPPNTTAAPKPTATPKPPAVASNFRGQNLFNYGAQLNWTNSDNNAEMAQLKQMGFNWAKIQVRWCDVEGAKGNADLSQIGRLVDAANAKGIKVMFSVVCAPNWSRADRGAGGSGPPDNMQDAADFMGGLAGFFCSKGLGAIEVWNEHNLLTEWHGKPISAAMYMDMLKRSYTKIKAACPSVVVVSGAPTPTGVMSDTAIDDVVFLQQLYQNGLKDYSDAVGAHPSGFGNPPDVPPGTPNPTGQFQGHRSFYFRGTMEAYRAVMVQYGDANKQIWPTEFGWGVDPNPKPGYEYEKFITEAQQAAWLVTAYQMMKGWGWVGVAILWNLDFMDMNNETGAFHVLNRPAFGALAGMPK
jgi:spore germination protein YaaH